MKTYLPVNWAVAVIGMVLSFIAALPAHSAVLQVPAGYPTIQAAINAAQSGDEVHIAAGVYKEQAIVTKKTLTLSGEPGTVVMASTKLVPSTRRNWNILFEFVSADVTVKGIDFEGQQLADNQPRADYNFVALYYGGSGGRVEDCVIRGFQGKTHLNSRSAGLLSYSPKGLNLKVVNLEIVHNTFADDGIAIWMQGDEFDNPTVLRTTALIENNTVIGSGPNNTSSDESQDGIRIEPSVGGTIRNNRVSNFYSNIPDPIFHAFGILAYDSPRFLQSAIFALQPLRIENNVLANNQNAIGVVRGDNCQVLNNVISGGRTNTQGLSISGTNITVNFNQFTNLTRGIVLLGNDPATQTATGIAEKAAVTDNRFCNVETTLVIQPLVTEVTEQGSLTCPFPDPTLEIASAVFLSWPSYADGWILESALSVQGPWTPMHAIPAVQNDRYTFFVKSDVQPRFFRLRAP